MTALASESVVIPIDAGQHIEADLDIPDRATGIVVFAHGSGSSRISSRNRAVADALQQRGVATLLVDLLTPAEKDIDLRTSEYRFDIERLAVRVIAATDWVHNSEDFLRLPVGLFGTSTGAAAALIAAAERTRVVQAVVSRGGRPDLGGLWLPFVKAPTLLIVGGDDEPVVEMNEAARSQMSAAHVESVIVPGASHLFEEPGALHQVEQLAGKWFLRYLRTDALIDLWDGRYRDRDVCRRA